jgi:hypothetical protein
MLPSSETTPFLALGRYEVARRAVAEARAVDDLLEVLGRNSAVHAYARQARDRQMEIDAVEIRIRAERRLGELMALQKAIVGVAKPPPPAGRNGRVASKPDHMPPTLEEAGIGKNLAHRARTYAAVSPDRFEKLLTDKRQADDRSVVLDPDSPAAAPAIERGRPGPRGLADRDDRLVREVAELRRRLAASMVSERMWKKRALAAGWREDAP